MNPYFLLCKTDLQLCVNGLCDRFAITFRQQSEEVAKHLITL